jgi:hypothetical protein
LMQRPGTAWRSVGAGIVMIAVLRYDSHQAKKSAGCCHINAA